jgi:hypothetical protein
MKQNSQIRTFDVGRDILKWIAIITMTIDHTGAVLYPEYEIFRIIGRLAFPLFGYLIVLGVESTRNVRNYFLRLFIFAFISQAPFYLALGYQPFEAFNIFFTLSFGVLSLTNPLLLFVSLIVSAILNFDYNVYGIALITVMRILRNNVKYGIILLVVLNIIFLFEAPTQVFSLLALPIILLYQNGFLGRETISKGSNRLNNLLNKYFFYAYYPIHLSVLYLIKSYLI